MAKFQFSGGAEAAGEVRKISDEVIALNNNINNLIKSVDRFGGVQGRKGGPLGRISDISSQLSNREPVDLGYLQASNNAENAMQTLKENFYTKSGDLRKRLNKQEVEQLNVLRKTIQENVAIMNEYSAAILRVSDSERRASKTIEDLHGSALVENANIKSKARSKQELLGARMATPIERDQLARERVDEVAWERKASLDRAMMAKESSMRQSHLSDIQKADEAAWVKKANVDRAAMAREAIMWEKQRKENIAGLVAEARDRASLRNKQVKETEKAAKAETSVQAKNLNEVGRIRERALAGFTRDERKHQEALGAWMAQGLPRQIKTAHSSLEEFRKSFSYFRNAVLLWGFGVEMFFGGIIRSIKTSVSALAEFQRMTSSAILIGQRKGFDQTQTEQAIAGLTEDGLLSITEAARGLGQLLTTGIGLPKSIELMKGLKNASALARQGHLQLGEAVVGATDGFKNFMSRMFDNIGVSTNLSVILERELKLRGQQKNQLNETQKYLVLLSGVMKELAVYEGGAAMAADQVSGALARMEIAGKKADISIGKLLEHWGAIKTWTDLSIAISEAAERLGNLASMTKEEREYIGLQSIYNNGSDKDKAILDEGKLRAEESRILAIFSDITEARDNLFKDLPWGLTSGGSPLLGGDKKQFQVFYESLKRNIDIVGQFGDVWNMTAKDVDDLILNIQAHEEIMGKTLLGALKEPELASDVLKNAKKETSDLITLFTRLKPFLSGYEVKAVPDNEQKAVSAAEKKRYTLLQNAIKRLRTRGEPDEYERKRQEYSNAVDSIVDQINGMTNDIVKGDLFKMIGGPEGKGLLSFLFGSVDEVYAKDSIEEMDKIAYAAKTIFAPDKDEYSQRRDAAKMKIDEFKLKLNKSAELYKWPKEIVEQINADLGSALKNELGRIDSDAAVASRRAEDRLNKSLRRFTTSGRKIAAGNTGEDAHSQQIEQLREKARAEVEKLAVDFNWAEVMGGADLPDIESILDLDSAYNEFMSRMDDTNAMRFANAYRGFLENVRSAIAGINKEFADKTKKATDKILNRALIRDYDREYQDAIDDLEMKRKDKTIGGRVYDEGAYNAEQDRNRDKRLFYYKSAVSAIDAMGSAADRFGNIGSKKFEKVTKAVAVFSQSLSQAAKGMEMMTAKGATGFEQFAGVMMITESIVGAVQAYRKKKDKGNSAAAGKDWGATISRGPTTMNFYPTLTVSADGDVIFSEDGLEVVMDKWMQMSQQALEFGELSQPQSRK